MNNIQLLLEESSKLFQYLGSIPKGEERDGFIEEINDRLDRRGNLIKALQQSGVILDSQNKIHVTLTELDSGIRERLVKIMEAVKHDMKDLQKAKKNEQQYMNPYSAVQVMDGMYYDKKK